MKKIIGVLLVVVLLASGLGSFSYVEANPGNEVHVSFATDYNYQTTYNSVENIFTKQPASMHVHLRNHSDTGADVVSPIVDLSTSYTVTYVKKEEYLVTPPPEGVNYRWAFPDIGEDEDQDTGASLDQTAEFWTGFSVTRSVDPVQVQAGGTQVLTLSVIPEEAMDSLHIHGRTDVEELDIATVTSVSGSPGIEIHGDGRGFRVHIDNPVLDQLYQWQVTIQIGSLPEGCQALEYMPRVHVRNFVVSNRGSDYGSSLSGESLGLDGGTVIPLGTWTWQATGDYSWEWDEQLSKAVILEGYAGNYVHAGFETAYRYRTAGNSVVNPTTNQPTHIHSWLRNNRDSTGQDVTEPILNLGTTQTVTHISSEYLVPGSTYRWEFPDIPEDQRFAPSADIAEVVEVSTGLSVSRSVSQIRFPRAGGIQVLTLSVTPEEAMDQIGIWGRTDLDELQGVANVTSVSGENIYIKDEGRGFDAWINEPVPGQLYQWEVTIDIGPLPPDFLALEYMPRINVSNVDFIDDGEFYGSSLSKELRSLDGTVVLGTWTWNTTGHYRWRWEKRVLKRVELEGYAMHSYVVAPTQGSIDEAIDKGLMWLRDQQHDDGAWYWGKPDRPNHPGRPEAPNVGMTGLALWCFLRSGILEDDPAVSRGIDFILSRQRSDPNSDDYGAIHSGNPVYETAIAILALRATSNPIYVDEIARATDYLVRSQNDEDVYYRNLDQTGITPDNWAYGGWGYRYGSDSNNIWVAGQPVEVPWYVWSDLSNTQFAIIALKAAEEAGIGISEDVWAKAQVFLEHGQNPDGGFGYKPTWELETHGSYGLMTAAGVWSLRLSGVSVEDERVQAGLAWLDGHPFYDRNPRSDQYHYYFLWSAAKAFALCDRPPLLEESEWYYDYAGYLLAYQDDSGQWVNPVWPEGESNLNATEYALLVLAKAVLPPPPPPPLPTAEAGGPYLVEVGLPLTLDGSASSCAEGRQIVQYYWVFGDGTTGRGESVDHTYNTAGLYTVKLMVVDNLSAVGTDSTLVAVYDPAAGFATGGGWFTPDKVRGDELPGLLENNTSPAEFGFVVKYKPGATELRGQLEFQYRRGDFNLHSKGMDWLVIVNNNRAKFQGTATIKGVDVLDDLYGVDAVYPFRVDARDGDFGGGTELDHFIIKVWAPDEDPDLDELDYKASGDLEKGSIVIHAKKVTTLRVQSSYPAGSPGYQVFETWAQAISEASGRHLNIEPYPANSIVPTFDAFDAVQAGTLDGFVSFPQYWAGKHALANYLSSYPFGLDEPYMWETWFYERGGIELAREDYARFNMHYVGLVQNPPNYAHSVIPLNTMADWDGLRCRYAGAMISDVFTKAGAEVFFLPGGEIWQAMDTGFIELGEFASHYTNKQVKLYEVGPYIIGPAQMHQPVELQAFVINMDAWNRLPPKLQQLLTTGVSDLSTSTFDAFYTADIEALQWMKDYGCEYIEIPVEERAKFRLISVEFWKAYATDAISLQAVESQILLMSEEGLLDFPGVKEEVEIYFPDLLP